ncbi:hypothetical protein MRX96_017301 [Rhipicephalus microplus]
MGDHSERPKLMPQSDGPPTAEALQLFGFPFKFRWTPGPTLPTEPLPYYYVERPYTVVARILSLPPWMVSAISYEVAFNHGTPWPPDASPHFTRNGNSPRLPEMQLVNGHVSHSPVEQGMEAVRSKGTRVRTHVSGAASRSKTPGKSLSKKGQQEHIKLGLLRLLRSVAYLRLGVPAKKKEPRCSAHHVTCTPSWPLHTHVVHAQELSVIPQQQSRKERGDHSERPKLMPHSDGPPPPRHFFRGLPQQSLPGFDGLRCAAYAQQLLGLPSTFAWTPGPTLPTEPLPYYYVQRPYTVVARFPSLPPWMVPAISYEVAPKHGAPWPPGANPHVARNGTPPRLSEMQVVKRRGGHSPVEQGTEAVRSEGTRVWPHVSATPSKSETLRSLSKEEQQEHIELLLTRLLRAVADLGLGVLTEKEEPRPSARKFVYSAAALRSLNVRRRASTPSPLSQYRDENPQGSATSTSSVC